MEARREASARIPRATVPDIIELSQRITADVPGVLAVQRRSCTFDATVRTAAAPRHPMSALNVPTAGFHRSSFPAESRITARTARDPSEEPCTENAKC
ncbi:MAG: hypothetical protein IPF79_06115 [Ignavibacteria bacterium]|nr:hypothetical protein [Ignavibacteria bacterium]